MFNYGLNLNPCMMRLMRILRTNLTGPACLLAFAVAMLPLSASAENAHKYGFVNISQVITQSDEGKAEAEQLKSMGTEKEKALNSKKEELQKLSGQYEKTVQTGKPDEQLGEKVKRLKRELDRDVPEAQSDVDTSRKDRIQALGNKAVEVIRKFAQANHYTAIFRVDSGDMVYVDPAVDVTEKVIAAYNKAHPAK